MARKPRLDFPGCWHHLMHRGARHEAIFREDSHRRLFLRCLGEACDRTGLEVHAFCLMTNHYHLLGRSPHGQVHRAMKHLNGTYSLRLNHRYGWDGPLFRDRYSNVIVSSDEHLRHLVAYIHLNPVKAMLCPRPEDHPWSSYRAYVGTAEAPPWLTTSMVRSLFPTTADLVAFTCEVSDGTECTREGVDLGRGALVSLSENVDEPGTMSDRERLPPEKVVEAVAAASGQTPENVTRSVWGRGGNPSRRMLAWALVEYSQLPHREIAALLDTQTNAVSCLLKRVQDRRGRGLTETTDG
jgi:putative transposase